jgi:trehalose-6-phosphatase
MTLLHGVPQHAILAGGSAVFSGGVRDREWDAKLRGDREGTCATNEQVVDLLPGFAVSERDGSLLVIATRKDGEAAAVASGIRAEVEQNGWAVHADGRRVYLSPRVVSKAGAAQWIMDRQPADRAVAAGDSELDRALVEWADEALVPAHAVLASQPISSRNIRVTAHRGTAAAAEICEWLTGLVG